MQCRSVKIHRPIADFTLDMNIGHWTLHIAHCAATTTGRAGPWSSESMTPCGTLFFCSLGPTDHPWPARDFVGRANATHARSSDASRSNQIPNPLLPPPELSNNGGELGPRPSCSSASRLSSSRLSPDGPWTGHGRDDVEGPRRSVRLLSR
jgi:hypothetical protein